MSTDRYPDKVSFRLPSGWRERLEALAVSEERSLADFLREHCRRILAAADKRAYRRRTANTK